MAKKDVNVKRMQKWSVVISADQPFGWVYAGVGLYLGGRMTIDHAQEVVDHHNAVVGVCNELAEDIENGTTS